MHCIVRRSLRSYMDGWSGIRKDSANATIFIERKGWSLNPDQRFFQTRTDRRTRLSAANCHNSGRCANRSGFHFWPNNHHIAYEPAPGELHLLAEDKDQEFDGCRQDSEGAMWNFRCLDATGNKESVQKTVYTLREADGRAALELIDEEAQQSTKGIETSLMANYDTSRSAP